MLFNPLGFNLGTRGHLGGLGFRGGHGGNMLTCLSIDICYSTFRGLPGDTGAFRGTGEPLGGDLGAYVNWRRATPVCCHMQAS